MTRDEDLMKNFEIANAVSVGDYPNLEGMKYPEAMNALSNINEAIQDVNKKGANLYGKENWDLIGAQ